MLHPNGRQRPLKRMQRYKKKTRKQKIKVTYRVKKCKITSKMSIMQYERLFLCNKFPIFAAPYAQTNNTKITLTLFICPYPK